MGSELPSRVVRSGLLYFSGAMKFAKLFRSPWLYGLPIIVLLDCDLYQWKDYSEIFMYSWNHCWEVPETALCSCGLCRIQRFQLQILVRKSSSSSHDQCLGRGRSWPGSMSKVTRKKCTSAK